MTSTAPCAGKRLVLARRPVCARHALDDFPGRGHGRHDPPAAPRGSASRICGRHVSHSGQLRLHIYVALRRCRRLRLSHPPGTAASAARRVRTESDRATCAASTLSDPVIPCVVVGAVSGSACFFAFALGADAGCPTLAIDSRLLHIAALPRMAGERDDPGNVRGRCLGPCAGAVRAFVAAVPSLARDDCARHACTASLSVCAGGAHV